MNIARGHPMASMIATVRSMAGRSSSFGIAAHPDLPGVRRWREAKAYTMCRAALSPFDRCAGFWSIATTPSEVPVSAAA
jgi:hypothetical protein